MSTMPWRILVITDVGVDSGAPATVAANGADAWLGSLGITVPLAGGKSHPVTSLKALEPAALAAALGGAPAGPALDTALHEPRLQRVESAWRGLQLLASHVGDGVELQAMSCPRAKLAARFEEAVYAPLMDSGDVLSLVVLDFDFTHKGDDLVTLTRFAEMGAGLQTCVVGNAGAGFFDLRFLVQAAAIQDVASRLTSTAHAGWASLQRLEASRWLTLTLNRFLLREPHQSDAWTERCTESDPESYLWGRGPWLVGAALARSIAAHGHALDLSGAGGRFGDRPTRGYPVKTNESKALATEIPFAEMQMLLLAHAAFAPLVGPLDQPLVSLPLVTTAHRKTPSTLTLEGTLAYQLTAARVAQVCLGALGGSPAGAADEALAGYWTQALRAGLGALVGDAAEAVAVTIAPADGDAPRTAEIVVRPPLTLEGKSPEFALGLPVD